MRIGGSGPTIVGGGIVESVFSYSPTTLTVGTASYPVSRMVFLSATATMGMGTTPLSNGAINIDTAPYASVGISLSNSGGSSVFRIERSNGTNALIFANTPINFTTESLLTWVMAGGSNISLLVAGQVTARIRGGSTNGLAVQNSGATRDNLTISDSGTTFTVGNGTTGGSIVQITSSGELNGGAVFGSDGTVMLRSGVGSAGAVAFNCYYFDGTVYRSAVRAVNATGFGTLTLMGSGGTIVSGATNFTLTAGGAATFAGIVDVSTLRTLAAGFMSWGTTRAAMSSPANSQINFLDNTGVANGVGFDFAVDAVLKIRTRAQTGYATIDALAYQVSGAAGIDFNGAITNLTVVKGIVTAAS